MKFKLKDDIWGVVFATGVGVVTWLVYNLGKSAGAIQTNEEYTEALNVLLEEAKQAHTEQ